MPTVAFVHSADDNVIVKNNKLFFAACNAGFVMDYSPLPTRKGVRFILACSSRIFRFQENQFSLLIT